VTAPDERSICPSCNRLVFEHTLDDTIAHGIINSRKPLQHLDHVCPHCDREDRDHTVRELNVCVAHVRISRSARSANGPGLYTAVKIRWSAWVIRFAIFAQGDGVSTRMRSSEPAARRDSRERWTRPVKSKGKP